MGAGGRSFLVTATPPTTNGDLHVGHLSGPYLAADVFSRAQRLTGSSARYVSGGDDHQTYVVTTAERLGRDPVELAAECNERIRETLRLADVDIAAFTSPNPEYVREVQGFFEGLWDAGRLVLRRYSFPYSRSAGRFLVEAFATGYCPECYTSTSGAICEDCGHPNDVASLLFASSTGASAGAGDIEQRELETLVLPLEVYRDRFVDFYERRRETMRPHVLRFVREMLAAPLPDFPVSYPGTWGIPVEFAGVEGQVLNAWAEMLPALVHMTGAGGNDDGATAWSAGSEYELVQFLGYDNTFYFAFAHLGLLFAAGTMIEPTAIVTNEFYYLDGSKFSTSRGHLIWARDLLTRHGADNVRFYLALENPEHQVANFNEDEFVERVGRRLHQPLAAAAAALEPHAGRPVELGDEEAAQYERFRTRMRRAYALETFSLREAAGTVANALAMAADLAGRADGPAAREARAAVAALLHVASYAEPLVPALCAELRRQLGAAPGPRLDPLATGAGGYAVPRLEPERLFRAL